MEKNEAIMKNYWQFFFFFSRVYFFHVHVRLRLWLSCIGECLWEPLKKEEKKRAELDIWMEKEKKNIPCIFVNSTKIQDSKTTFELARFLWPDFFFI